MSSGHPAPDLTIENLPNVGLDGDRYYRPMSVGERVDRGYTGAIMGH